MENDTIKGGDPYRFFTDRSELERCLGGIQSVAKNLFLFLYLERLLLRIVRWANYFCRFKGVEKVFIHPNGWNYFRFVRGGRMRFAPTKIVTFPRHGNRKMRKLFFIKSNKLYWCTGPVPSVQDDRTWWRRTVQILHFSFRIRNEFSKDFQKNISPTLWVIRRESNFSIKISPLPGVSNLYKHSSFRRKHFSLRLISSGGKMERMPMTCAMGLALECFQWIIPTKGMIFWKIFPTIRHSFHVRGAVRKATLNGPKPFGYFWAPKVTMRICFFLNLLTLPRWGLPT